MTDNNTNTGNVTDNVTDNGAGSDGTALSELEVRETALASIRDAVAALQDVPAVGLDAEKHDRLTDSTDDLLSLERQLTNEISQIRENEDGEADE